MKLTDVVPDHSFKLDADSLDTPLPSGRDVYGHLSCLIAEAKTAQKPYTLALLYYEVAAALIACYQRRSLPTLTLQSVMM